MSKPLMPGDPFLGARQPKGKGQVALVAWT